MARCAPVQGAEQGGRGVPSRGRTEAPACRALSARLRACRGVGRVDASGQALRCVHGPPRGTTGHVRHAVHPVCSRARTRTRARARCTMPEVVLGACLEVGKVHGEAVFAVVQEAEVCAAAGTAPAKGGKAVAPRKEAKSAPRLQELLGAYLRVSRHGMGQHRGMRPAMRLRVSQTLPRAHLPAMLGMVPEERRDAHLPAMPAQELGVAHGDCRWQCWVCRHCLPPRLPSPSVAGEPATVMPPRQDAVPAPATPSARRLRACHVRQSGLPPLGCRPCGAGPAVRGRGDERACHVGDAFCHRPPSGRGALGGARGAPLPAPPGAPLPASSARTVQMPSTAPQP